MIVHPNRIDTDFETNRLEIGTGTPMSFDTFLDWYPNDGYRYELIEGRVIKMLPTGPHEDVSGDGTTVPLAKH